MSDAQLIEEQMAILRYTHTSIFELADFPDLDQTERAVVLSALAAWENSEDTTIRAGACAVAIDGTMHATHNAIPGSHGHAEQRAVTGLFELLPAGHKQLKTLGLAVSLAGEELVRPEEVYAAAVPLPSIRASLPCGKCLEFISDVSANVDDVRLLLIAGSGQVVRTSLRALMPWPYVSIRVRYDCNKRAPIYRRTTKRDQERKVALPNLGRAELALLAANWLATCK